MKNSEILTLARVKIEKKTHRFICNAINAVADEHGFTSICTTRSKLVGWVAILLEGHSTLEDWLVHMGFESDKRWFTTEENTNKLINTRLAWIDWMIKYWQDQEAVGKLPDA